MHEVAARDTYGCSLDLQAAGGARSLAVSNFSPAQLDAILKEPCVRLQPYAPQAATLQPYVSQAATLRILKEPHARLLGCIGLQPGIHRVAGLQSADRRHPQGAGRANPNPLTLTLTSSLGLTLSPTLTLTLALTLP